MSSEIIIQPKKRLLNIDLREIWQYRELLFVLAWRDISVRYKQTLLGISWAIFQPLLTTGIFSVFFGKIAHLPSDGLPYPLFTFIGLTFWNFFSAGVSGASNSLISNAGIISKVYFPRLIVPLAAILTSGVDFLITFTVLLIGLLVFGYFPLNTYLLVFPILLVIMLLSMGGFGLFTAALNIKYRDVRYALPFFIQMGLYITPIIYPISVIYDYRKYLLMLNPMTAVIEGTRAIIRNVPPDDIMIAIGFIVAIVIFVIGFVSFREAEDLFADIT